jgi:tetratricopeptide (TPR) repeat protein
MLSDARGLALTADNEAAVAHYNTAIDHYFEYRLDTGKCVKRALEADPGFAMGHCFKGYLFMLFGSAAFVGRARQALEQAEASAGGVTKREAGHIAALGTWAAGDMTGACAAWDRILLDHPRDLLALRLQHFAYFWLGRSDELLGGPARVMYAWDRSVPGYGNVLGMLSFGLEECGRYYEAEARGKAAVEISREDLWALHAVAHVFEMQGRHAEGAAWLDYPADAWDDRNPFRGHLWWHRALFLLERGEHDAVLELYDRSIRPGQADFYLDIQNAAALLARLGFLGVDVGSRWVELADHVETRLDDRALAFTDAHSMMALAAARREEAARRLLDSLRSFGRTPGDDQAATMDPVTVPLCEGILAYGEGDYARAVERLMPLRSLLLRVGGSHAQRDIFVQYLIEAAIRDGNLALARALLSERTLTKPNSPTAWTKYAAVLEVLGDHAGAAAARNRGSAVAAV